MLKRDWSYINYVQFIFWTSHLFKFKFIFFHMHNFALGLKIALKQPKDSIVSYLFHFECYKFMTTCKFFYPFVMFALSFVCWAKCLLTCLWLTKLMLIAAACLLSACLLALRRIVICILGFPYPSLLNCQWSTQRLESIRNKTSAKHNLY